MSIFDQYNGRQSDFARSYMQDMEDKRRYELQKAIAQEYEKQAKQQSTAANVLLLLEDEQ